MIWTWEYFYLKAGGWYHGPLIAHLYPIEYRDQIDMHIHNRVGPPTNAIEIDWRFCVFIMNPHTYTCVPDAQPALAIEGNFVSEADARV